jgi:hypothetical protein
MLSPEDLSKLETEHKRIAHVIGKNAAWEVVIRKPTRPEFKRFKSMAMNPAQQADALEHMIRTIVVYPSRAAFDALLEDYPAIPAAFDAQLAELTGAAVDESVK